MWWSWVLRDMPNPPFALWDPVCEHLYIPPYKPTRREIESAREYLRKHELATHRAALVRLLRFDTILFSKVIGPARRRQGGS